jgi:hypothetical protein
MLPHETGEFKLVGGAPDEAAVQAGVGLVRHLGSLTHGEGERAQALGSKLRGAAVTRFNDLSLRHSFTLALEAFGHGLLLIVA